MANASSRSPGFSHLQGVFDKETSIFRKRIDLVSVGGVGTVGMFLSDEYSGGGERCRSMSFCGIVGASVGGAGAWRAGTGGAGDGTTTSSVRLLDDRLIDPGLLLNSFMRFVDSVRRNCVVRSLAQFSGSGCADAGCGTGFRRGTPFGGGLRSAMVAAVV